MTKTPCPKCGTASANPEVCEFCGALIGRIRERSAAAPPPLPEEESDGFEEQGISYRPGGSSGEKSNRSVLYLTVAAVAVAAFMLFRSIMPSAGSASVAELSSSEFEAQVLKGSPAQTWVVDLWAPWCGPCRQFGPEFAATAELLGGRASFAKVNVDNSPDVARQFAVTGIPTVLVIREGQVVERLTGGMRRDDFRRWVEQHL